MGAVRARRRTRRAPVSGAAAGLALLPACWPPTLPLLRSAPPTNATLPDASDSDVMLMLMGYKQLPSEGNSSVLAAIADRNAQRLLRHLVRRAPTARWDAAKVVSCIWFRTSDFQSYRVTG